MSDATTAVSQYTYGVNLQNNSGSNKPAEAGGMYVSGAIAGTHDNAVKFIFNSAVSASVVSASYFFGDATYLDNVTATSVGTFSGSKVVMLGTALFSNAASMKLSGTISGAAGATLQGPVILSHGTSMKASGSVSSATTVSGTVSLASSKLTINNVDVITQAGSVAVPGDVSGAATLKGAALTIDNTAIVTQAKALGGVTTISGASSLAGAKLTINGNDVITQAGAGAFAGNISGTSDIIANRFSGSERGMVIHGSTIFSKASANDSAMVMKLSGNLSGAGNIVANRFSGSERGMTILGNAILSNNLSVSGTVASKGDLTGAGDIKGAALTINGDEVITQAGVLQNVTFSPSSLSGNVKLNIFPEALFSNAASAIKASGSITGSNIVATTTVSGTVSLASSKLTINGNDVITQGGSVAVPGDVSGAATLKGAALTIDNTAIVTQAKALGGVTTISGASSLAGAKLTINGSDIVTQAKALGNVTTISGASSLAGAKLTINGNDVITQAGAGAFAGNISGTSDVIANRFSGSERGMVIHGSTIFSKASANDSAMVMKLSGNLSGAGNIVANRFSGSERGMTILGNVIFSNNLSVSGTVASKGDLTGAGDIKGAALTINGDEVITQAGVLQNVTFSPSSLSGNVKLNIFPEALFSNAASAIKASGSITGSNIVATTTVSGTVSLASSKLTINGSDIVTQAKALGNVTTISGASSLAGAKLTINGNDVITQAGAGAFAGNISGTSDVIANRFSGSERGMVIHGSTIFSKASANDSAMVMKLSGNLSGAGNIVANRFSGSERGMTILGNAILSNNLSVSGAVVGATTLSGAGEVSGQSLKIGNKAIISQAGAIGNATTISGASSLAGAKLTINGDDVITQAGVLQNVTFSPSALSGNVKLNIFPTALFSNAASMKLSGTISGAAGAVLGGPVVISHNLSVSGAVVGATTLSGAGKISGQHLGVTNDPGDGYVAHIGGATSTSGSLIVGKMGTGHNIEFYGDTMGRKLFWDQAGDTLHLSGTTRLSGTLTVGGKADPGSGESQGFDVSFYGHDSDNGSATGSFFWDASAEKLLLGSGSLIGIGLGATNVSYAVHLPNVAGAAGQIKANAFVTYSSRKMKTNINPINNPLDKVMKLQGVTYNWKSSPNGGKDLGLIAEDVREVLPHVVHEATNGHAGIDYARITSLLVEAVKEQQKQIQELKSKIEK